ncbi:Metallo-dependent phosphatase-like protein, partial [Coemansia spiralis]
MAPVDAETASRADALKLEANKLFAQKQYHEAIAKYTAAIALSPVPAYYTNRAQCHLLTEGYGAAKADADTALALDPSFIKAFYRRAAANLAMGRLKEARADFREVTTRLPSDAAAKTKYVECDKLYRRIQFEKAIDSEIDRKRVAQMIELDNYPVPSDYEGPRMPVREGTTEEYVDLAFVKALVEWFREQKTLPVRYAYAILLQADRLLRSLPTLVDIAVPTDTVLTVCGDVHGQFYDVLNIFDLNGFPSPNLMYLFNGDFVDRGSFSVEVVLLFLALKLLYPESFFLNRGNHEATGMNQLYGFEGEVRHKYAVQGKRVFDLFQEVFEALPVAHLIGNKILVLHGGLYSNDTGRPAWCGSRSCANCRDSTNRTTTASCASHCGRIRRSARAVRPTPVVLRFSLGPMLRASSAARTGSQWSSAAMSRRTTATRSPTTARWSRCSRRPTTATPQATRARTSASPTTLTARITRLTPCHIQTSRRWPTPTSVVSC